VAPPTLPADHGQRLEPPTPPNTNPQPATLGHRFLAELCARGRDPDGYARWRRQVRAAGYCQRPVRLVGAVEHVDPHTGEARTVLDSAGEPDGVLLTACGTRRAARCPPCAEVYRADAYQLLRAGLAGGKGVPESVAGHPRLFVTFTAPSFGSVHSSRVRGGRVQRCHPARADARCPHGRLRRCALRHVGGDPTIGTPICADCYDHQRAVVWNALAPALWKRTTIYLRRAIARLAGLSAAEAGRRVRPAYVKVAEYQARGAVHLHAVIRLDATPPQDDPDQLAPPPAGFTIALLAQAIRQAAAQAAVPCPLGGAPIRWGDQLDLRPVHAGLGEGATGQVAGYLAKYATKATEGLGANLDARIGSRADLERRELPEHTRRLVHACWALGAQPPTAGLGLRRWAHMLGFGGHCTTKSRRYSVTFAALRAARRSWNARRRHGPAVQLDQDGREYAGRGYSTLADAWLAASMATDHQQARQLAREELSRVA